MSGNIQFDTYATVADMPNADDANHLRLGVVGTQLVGKDSSGNVYYFENARQPSAVTATSNATPTIAYTSPALAQGSAMYIRFRVVGKKTDLSASLTAWIEGGWRRASGGNITSLGSANSWVLEDSGGAPTVSLAVNTTSQTVELSVTGVAAENWTWQVWAEISLY